THLWVCNVFVEHDSVQHSRVFNFPSRNLLHARVSFDINLLLSATDFLCDGTDGLECKTAHELRPPVDEFSANGGGDELVHGFVVIYIDGNRYLFDNVEGICQCLLKG